MLTLSDGRPLGYDDVGDPGGWPVVYLHGTPDSRLARHPDDKLAAEAGIRLLAVDRPGYGASAPAGPGADPRQPEGPRAMPDQLATGSPTVATADPREVPDQLATGSPTAATADPREVPDQLATGSPTVPTADPREMPDQFAADLGELLDHLGIDRASLLAWSGGTLAALAAAASPPLAGRVTELTVVAGVVPREAYDDPTVYAADAGRASLFELADSMPPADLAEVVAPMLAPYPCDQALAAEHQREHRSPTDQAALEAVPGAVEQMAAALVEAVRSGLAGVATDVAAQHYPAVLPPLGRVELPVRLWYGSEDQVTPSAFGTWYAERLPNAQLRIIEGAGHVLFLTHWPHLLAHLTR